MGMWHRLTASAFTDTGYMYLLDKTTYKKRGGGEKGKKKLDNFAFLPNYKSHFISQFSFVKMKGKIYIYIYDV